jgi:hypothetical protein
MQPTITLDEAKARAATYVQQIVGALPVKARLDSFGMVPTSMECTDPTDNGPPGRYDYGVSYFLRDIPKERNPEIMRAFLAYLTKRGFVVQTKNDSFLSLENPQDGFGASLQQSGSQNRGLSLTVSSPCVWPNGTPSPQ